MLSASPPAPGIEIPEVDATEKEEEVVEEEDEETEVGRGMRKEGKAFFIRRMVRISFSTRAGMEEEEAAADMSREERDRGENDALLRAELLY